MDTRKLTLVPMNVKGFPDADLAYAAYPDGSTAIGAAPTEDQEELVRRWNAHQVMHDALVEIATIQESSNTWDPEDIGKALDNAVATAQGALRALKEGTQEDIQPFTVILQYPDYIPNEGGHPTWMGHVTGKDKSEAVLNARTEVMRELDENVDPEDLYTIAVFAGHHNDLNP